VCGFRKQEDTNQAGFDRVSLHKIGPDQEGFFNFYQREVLPGLQEKA
jgi:hypothetical protein